MQSDLTIVFSSPLLFTKSDDVSTLKRLLREVFSDLVKVRSRLDEIETATGLTSSDTAASDATPLETSSRARQLAANDASPRLRSVLSGALKIGGGFLWEDDVNGDGLGAVQEAGVRLGSDLILRVGSPIRGGRDAVMAEVRVDPENGAERFALQKILYNCRLAPSIRAIMAPFGARGQDVAYTLNPLAGQGLTSAVKHGNPLHQKVLGSVIGAAADLKRLWFSIAYFSQSTDSGMLQDTLLAQAVIAPVPAASIGLMVLEPLGNADDEESLSPGSGVLASMPPPPRQVGATLALAGGELALHGWAAADGDIVETRSWHEVQWGLTLGPQDDGSGNGWCLGMGKVNAAGLGPADEDLSTALQPNLFEVSTQWNLGDGMLITPGVVVLRRSGQSTVFAGVKTAWHF